MDKLPDLLQFERDHKPGNATYAQCKRIYALMKLCDMTPVWCNDMTYENAVAMQTTLDQIAYQLQRLGNWRKH
jgi:hypothetical protein